MAQNKGYGYANGQHKTADMRKFKNTYVARLCNVPDMARVRHCAEDQFGIKNCDAFQTLPNGRTVIWARNDLVEVFK